MRQFLESVSKPALMARGSFAAQIEVLKQLLCATVFMAVMLVQFGCDGMSNPHYINETRKENGLVIILPGIEGESGFNQDIRRGLASAGCYRAIPIYSWGRPIPGIGLLLNQVDIIGNRIAGGNIAKMIEKYQDSYPGRPVYLIGHSGGGGIAVFAAEELSPERKIDGLVLLSASIDSNYDLSKALRHCRNGIVNFYNREDTGLLGFGTAVMGNVDGGRGPSAGLTGFAKPFGKLYQVQITRDMINSGGGGSHDAVTKPRFVIKYVTPWVLSSIWPPDYSMARRQATGMRN